MTWALVTGAAARGGAAISRALHGAGLGIVVHHSPRSRATAQSLVAELNERRDESARLWEAEFSGAVDVPEWLTALAPAHCICNASVYKPSQLSDLTRATEDLAVHVMAHAAVLSALRPSLRSVVTVSDIHVDRPARDYVWYTVSKAGLQAMTLALATEWAPAVRCNVVAPGALPFPEQWDSHERERAVLPSIPMGRLGNFEDLATAVKWLALDATYVTGQVLAIDGGRSRWLA